jgi:hypothetical protein
MEALGKVADVHFVYVCTKILQQAGPGATHRQSTSAASPALSESATTSSCTATEADKRMQQAGSTGSTPAVS